VCIYTSDKPADECKIKRNAISFAKCRNNTRYGRRDVHNVEISEISLTAVVRRRRPEVVRMTSSRTIRRRMTNVRRRRQRAAGRVGTCFGKPRNCADRRTGFAIRVCNVRPRGNIQRSRHAIRSNDIAGAIFERRFPVSSFVCNDTVGKFRLLMRLRRRPSYLHALYYPERSNAIFFLVCTLIFTVLV